MRSTYGWFLLAALTPVAVCWAQARPGAAPPREGGAPAAHAATHDQQIAAFLYGCARNEVEISKFAQSRLQSEEAKEFAARMVKDHEPGLKKLAHAAGNLAAADKGGSDEPRRDDSRASGHAMALDWVHIHRQIADQVLASTKEGMQKEKSEDFDKCYMSQQIMAHMKVLDELKVLRTYASSELRKEIDETSDMAANHLKDAKKIMETEKERGSERTSRKTK
jgi:predicted outer membrane protein